MENNCYNTQCVDYDNTDHCNRYADLSICNIRVSGPEACKIDSEITYVLNTKQTSALDTQVGGSHYKQYKIGPYEFFLANKIPHHKAAIIRRILRYDHETGKGLEDLQKIKHEIELIIELEKWE